MEQQYIITLSGESTGPVSGTENLTTMEELKAWMDANQEYTPNPAGSEFEFSGKYVLIPKP